MASTAHARGSWSVQPFEPLDPFEPLNPGPRRPLPRRPFENSGEAALEEPIQIDREGR